MDIRRSLKGNGLLLGLLFLLSVAFVACGPATANTGTSESSEENNTDIGNEDADQEEGSGVKNIAADSDDQPAKNSDNTTAGLDIDPSATETDEKGMIVGFTTDGHPFRGDPNAPVIIKEYSDYQCPFCSRFYDETLPAIEEKQLANGDAVLVFYDFPLNNIHPQASAAANAARCAGEQSATAYWSMHNALFEGLSQWSNSNADVVFSGYAEGIGLDVGEFEACIAEGKYDKAVEDDLDSGVALGISGTPSFLINGQLLVGAQPIAVFDNAINTIKEGGQLASNEPQQNQGQPPPAPTPAAVNDEFAGAMGNPEAPVTIVEFTDYQCPFCARHSLDTMPAIVREMVDSGRVYYILKDLPLDQLHPNARSAAAAARCGGEQDAYWEMHDSIFGNQAEWAGQGANANDLFIGYASDLGLDQDTFTACLDSGRYDDAVEANATEARSLGISGTPFFLINGYPLNGARPIEHFQIAVELAEEGRLAEAYTPPEQPQEPQQPAGPVEVPLGDAFAIGNPAAPITIVEYTDFQCPFCSRHFNETFPQIKSQFVDEGIVRYVFKDFPLNNIHPQAAVAAEAARCAGDQEAYLEMHNLLFERQNDWSGQAPIDIFTEYAGELGLDADAFKQCLSDDKYASAVEADLQEGIELGVTGTPAFFINGYFLSGAQPFTLFEQAIEGLLSEQAG